ncbi:MAG: sugar phosphate isomerase/epimerase [Isosphaeraceae bacterium]|jgi:sugar phosphate isomerase/epimerase
MIRLSAFADEISQDPLEQIDVLTRHGIRHIEFRAIHGTNVLDLDDEQHEAYRGLLRARGFGLSALGSPIGKIRITESFDNHLLRFGRALDLADFYETPRIRVFSFYIPPGDDPAVYREEVIARMKELARRAESRGVTLLLENEKGIYGDTAQRVSDLLESVDSPVLAHAFDPANYVEVGQDIDQAWSLLHARVRHFHVKDYNAKTHRNVPAGAGDGQIPSLMERAVEGGYDGFVVLEPHLVVAELSFGFTGPERFADAAKALKNILDQLAIAYA